MDKIVAELDAPTPSFEKVKSWIPKFNIGEVKVKTSDVKFVKLSLPKTEGVSDSNIFQLPCNLCLTLTPLLPFIQL